MAATHAIEDELLIRLRAQAEAKALSWDQWAKQILAEAVTAENRAGRELNQRRLELIDQKYRAGLSDAEQREFVALQAFSEVNLERLDQSRLDWLERFEDRVSDELAASSE